MYSYVISTCNGAIPHIVDSSNFTSPFLVYVDDFYYKDSFYSTKKEKINDFLNTNKQVLLVFKGYKRLETKKGLFDISRERYNELVNTMQPAFYETYNLESKRKEKKTSKNKIEEKHDDKFEQFSFTKNIKLHILQSYDNKDKIMIYSPETVEDFVFLLKRKEKILSTKFINNITENKKMLFFDGNKIFTSQKNNCECCDLHDGYLQHLWNQKEICAFTYTNIHNYKQLDRIYEAINSDIALLEELQYIKEI